VREICHEHNKSLPIIRGWYNMPTVADVPSGLSLTPPTETKKKNKKTIYILNNVERFIAISNKLDQKSLIPFYKCGVGDCTWIDATLSSIIASAIEIASNSLKLLMLTV
jgi:hypothetical protein